MTSKGALSTLYPALLAIINNVAAYLENLNAASSGKLLQLFGLMSSPGFLLANESNHKLLESLLESMNAIVEHQYTSKLPDYQSLNCLCSDQNQRIQFLSMPFCIQEKR